MTNQDLVFYFFEHAPYVDPTDTVDRLIFGDKYAEVDKVVVTWMCDIPAIEYARSIGAATIITHEPTFYNTFDLNTFDMEHEKNIWAEDYYKWKMIQSKRDLLERSGISVIRNHDVWDRFPEWGIPFSWARHLGLKNMVSGDPTGYQYRYDIEPVTLKDFANKAAERIKPLGEEHIAYFGDDNALVSRIGVGTGCACAIELFYELGCDLSIICDDDYLSSFWREISWALDAGHPVVRVAHCTAEEPGMQSLTEYINGRLPINASYFRSAGRYKFI